MNSLNLPQIVALASGERRQITDVRATDIVFNLLGSAPAEGQPETVLATGQGQPTYGAEFATLSEVIAFLDNPPSPPAPRWRVTKDTIWTRLKALGYRTQAEALFLALAETQRLDWDNNAWFWCDNDPLRLMLEQGLSMPPADIETVFSPDSYTL